MQEHYDILMVGAGLSNAALAALLSVRGYSILMVDARKDVGGNCHTTEMGGITVHDYGAHIFHTSNEEVWRFANKYDNFIPFVNSPVARAKLSDKMKKWLYPENSAPDYLYLNMPFNMNTFSKIWWNMSPGRIIDRFKHSVDQFCKGNPQPTYRNLEEKAIGMVGEVLYELLVKGYTEKQWGKPCSELPADGIINRLPVRFNWDNNYFNDKYQGMPEHGYTSWINEMIHGPFSKVDVLMGVNYLDDRAQLDAKADIVFYSGRLDDLFDRDMGELPFRSLKFTVEDKATYESFQGVPVMNYTTDDVPYTRTIEHRLFCPWKGNPGHTVVSTEYPAEMKPGAEPYYPVNNAESDKLYNAYAERLVNLDNKICPTGRLGLFKYMDMDDCIEKAIEMDNRIAKGVTIAEEYLGTDTPPSRKIQMLKRALSIQLK